jgi:hypothetical protein
MKDARRSVPMSTKTIATIISIKAALQDYNHRLREEYKFYSQDLINSLFT